MRIDLWLYKVPLRLRSFFRRSAVEQELSEEMQYHLERQIEQNIARGLTREEARYAALRALGGIEQRKEECRQARRMNFIDDLQRDILYAFRGLTRDPIFTIVAVVTIAVGIGANTSIFSIVNAALLRPLPYPNPDRLIVVESISPTGGLSQMSPADFPEYPRQSATLEGLAGHSGGGISLQIGERSETISGHRVTANFFDVLKVRPMLGRLFTEDEMRIAGPRESVAVIVSHRFWMDRLGGDPSVIGKQIRSGNGSTTVIGVMPPEFKYPSSALVWLPIPNETAETKYRSSRYWYTVGRLRDGQSIESARIEITGIAARLSNEYPNDNRNWKAEVTPLADRLVRGFRTALLVLMAAVSVVLLIVCANVSSLMLARSASRRREVSVRLALGAGRWRLMRQFLVEGLLLSVLSAAGGLLLANWGIQAFFALLADTSLNSLLAVRDGIRLDSAVYVFVAGISILTTLIFATVPAWFSLRLAPAESLRATGLRHLSRSEQRVHKSIVVAEFALALLLLAGAGLLIQSFVRMTSVDYGYDPQNLLIMDFPMPQQNRELATDRVLDEIRSAPGIESAAVMSYATFGGLAFPFDLEGAGLPGGNAAGRYSSVSANYFRVLKTPLIAGREFNERDTFNAPGVAIINETLARQYFADENPIGRKIVIAYGGQRISREIVGIAGDIRQEEPVVPILPEVFVHWPQLPWLGGNLVIRAQGNPAIARDTVRKAIWNVDKNLPAANVRTVDEILGGQVAEPRLYMTLFGIFAAMAMFLAALGIYGLLSTIVNRHIHEMAIRMAVGARGADVIRFVVGQGMRLSGAGIAIGLIATFLLTDVLKTLLFGVTPTDLLTLVGAATLLFFVGLAACYIPARRAVRVDPLIALRHE